MGRVEANTEEFLTGAFGEYRQRIFNYVHSRTGNPVTSDQLTGEIFARLCEAELSQNGAQVRDRSNVLSWLFRSAKNAVVDEYRYESGLDGNGLDSERLDSMSIRAGDSVESAFESRELEETVTRALKQLAPNQANVIVCMFGLGLSIQETAEILNTTELNVRVRKTRGLDKLSKVLPKDIG